MRTKHSISPVLLAGLVSVWLLPVAIGAAPDESLARFVPADAGLYVEATNSEDLLIALSTPQLWVSLAEVAGQPADIGDTKIWEQRIRDTIGMGTTEAIQRLFSRQVAFVGPAPGKAQDAAILCRPRESVKPLLAEWKARPLPHAGKASSYRLFANLGLALWSDVACFGDPQQADGVYRRVLNVVDAKDNASLARNKLYVELSKRLPADYDAMFFARFGGAAASGKAATTQPATANAGVAICATMKRQNGWLDFRIVSNRDDVRRDGADLRPLLHGLPRDAIAHWAGTIDYDGLLGSAESLPQQSPLRIALQIMNRDSGLRELLENLAGPTVVVAGTATPTRLLDDAPAVPVLAFAVKTRDAETVATQLEATLGNAASVYNLLALQRGWPLVEAPALQTIAGVESHTIDLRPLLGTEPEKTPIGELELCWAFHDDELILATHSTWLGSVMRARQAADILSAQDADRAQAPPTVQRVEVRTRQLAALGGAWLQYWERTSPHILTEQYWRKFQPGGGFVRLGFVATQKAAEKLLVVDKVGADSPASSVIQPGDAILGFEGRRFQTETPAQEFRDGLMKRPHARWIDLQVRTKSGRRVTRRIPLPFFNPIDLLRRLDALQNVVTDVSYAEYRAPNAAAERRLRIRLAGMSQAGERETPRVMQPQSSSAAEDSDSSGEGEPE